MEKRWKGVPWETRQDQALAHSTRHPNLSPKAAVTRGITLKQKTGSTVFGFDKFTYLGIGYPNRNIRFYYSSFFSFFPDLNNHSTIILQ